LTGVVATMRAETESKLIEIWYRGGSAPAWLRALVPAYRAGQRLDRWIRSRSASYVMRAPDSSIAVLVGNFEQISSNDLCTFISIVSSTLAGSMKKFLLYHNLLQSVFRCTMANY